MALQKYGSPEPVVGPEGAPEASQPQPEFLERDAVGKDGQPKEPVEGDPDTFDKS